MKGIPTTVIMDCETQVPHPLTMRFKDKKNGKEEKEEPLPNEEEFVKEFTKSSSPYNKIDHCYFKLLWRVMQKSDDKTLESAIIANDQLDPLTGLAHQKQLMRILAAAQAGTEFTHNSPISHVFFADFAK